MCWRRMCRSYRVVQPRPLVFVSLPQSWKVKLRNIAEYKVHAVVLLPNVKTYWFSLVQLATVRSIEVALVAAAGCFQLPSTDGGLGNWRYPRCGMVAYVLDFRNTKYAITIT